MPTNYPTSLDTLTNPAAINKLNAPSHSDQHVAANDAIEAIEARLGTGADTTPGAASRVLRSTSSSATEWNKLALATDITGSLSIESVSGFSTFPIPVSSTALGTYTQWTDFVSTITVSGGTAPTYTGNFISRYRQVGKQVDVQLWWTNTAGGTAGAGGNPIIFTLPVTALHDGTGTSTLTWGMAQVYNGAATAAWLAAVCGASTTTAQLVIADAGDSTYANLAGGNQNNAARAISAHFSYEVA